MLVIVPIVAVFVCGFIPVTKSDSFKINAPFDNVYRELISPKNWLSWQQELKQVNQNQVKIDSDRAGFRITGPTITVDVQQMGLGNFAITQTQGDKAHSFNYALIPDSKTNKSLVTVNDKTNLFGCLAGLIIKSHDSPPLAGLKTFMEDTRQYYGFIIRKELTEKKLIAVERNTFLSAQLFRQAGEMLIRLNDFIKKNKLEITSPLQMQYVAVTKDSTQVMMGFPVNKVLSASHGVQFMTMPQSRILVGYFNDSYKNKEKLYNAMRQYMRDNFIHPMIQPFERFDNNKLPASDSSVVNMQLIVPYM